MAKYKSKIGRGKCVFCEIVKGNISPMGNGLIWEDKNFMAWLSPFPNTEGFSVVIPKKHYDSDVLKMPDKDLKEFILASKKVSNILLNYFEDVGRIGLIMEGTGIDHAHIKIVPMHGTDHMKKGIWKQYISNKSDYLKKYSGYISSHDGPKANLEKLEGLAKNIREGIK